ncbi:MAG: hypothetical protein WD960_07450 [Gemmatimonadota bacterium]
MIRVLGTILVALALPAATLAQEPTGWRLSGGGGVGTTLHRGDDAGWGALAGTARVGLERSFHQDRTLAFEWIGVWLAGDWGPESRHHVGVTGILARGSWPVRGRLGLGVGMATVIDTDGPGSGDPPGDLLVGIGTYGSVDALVGVELRARTGGSVAIVPAADLLVQRAGGATVVTGLLTARIRIG